MDPNSYSDVNKSPQSAFYNALSGSVCFPMPVMYNPINSYPFAPFLPMHHPMLSNHGLQDSHLISNSDIMGSNQLSKGDDINTRALAYLHRYQMNKCFFSPSRKSMGGKYCVTPPSLDMSNDCGKISGSSYGIQSSGDSNGSGVLPSLTSATSPTSGGYTDKECYLSSPSTEVEEPDSSGKCSTDVVEQKVVPRWTCDSSQPPVCPICGKTLSLQDLSDHFHLELDRLNDLVRKKEWLVENSPDQMTDMRLPPYHDVEKKCPEFRKETYLRVKANRMSRLGGLYGGGPRSKRQCFEEAKQPWKPHRVSQLCSPKQEHIEESSTQSSHQSMLMLELTVQQLAHRTEARAEVTTESYGSENRNISHYPGQLQPSGDNYHEDQNKTDMADSSCNGFNNLEVGSCQPSTYSEPAQRQHGENRSDENPCSSVDIKCQVCMESYKKPVVSVCCWHVHCETCWLKALGNKRVCPQCDTITSPSDLRRIHL
ncbi:unnamed protein product [Larinioides sclopetarius]|uniref:RING-type domain-containing protein n=2 Tax=Larinioides sclopetarius TaxID=280406 RepID=A0AAV2AF01_9ARAC